LDLNGFAKNGKLPAEDRDKKTQVSGEIPVFFCSAMGQLPCHPRSGCCWHLLQLQRDGSGLGCKFPRSHAYPTNPCLPSAKVGRSRTLLISLAYLGTRIWGHGFPAIKPDAVAGDRQPGGCGPVCVTAIHISLVPAGVLANQPRLNDSWTVDLKSIYRLVSQGIYDSDRSC